MTEILWTPSQERIDHSQMLAFMQSLNKTLGIDLKSY